MIMALNVLKKVLGLYSCTVVNLRLFVNQTVNWKSDGLEAYQPLWIQ